MMKTSGFIERSVRTVSFKDSPFVTLLVDGAMLDVSALMIFAASSKDVRVRVLGS